MNWTDEKQARFDELRQRKTAGTLTKPEQQELDSLVTALTQAADDALLPSITKLQQKQVLLEVRMQQRQHENKELIKLLRQLHKNSVKSWRLSNDDYNHSNH